MADNYLEKRMDDLRSGRLKGRSGGASPRPASRAGWIQWKFPSLRVLVVADTASSQLSALSESLVRRLVALGCKVALTDGDSERGARLSHDPGVRYYSLGDASSAVRDISSLLSVWHDLDAVIVISGNGGENPSCRGGGVSGVLPAIEQAVAAHRSSLPYPNTYGGRWLNIGTSSFIPTGLAPFSFTVNSIETISPYSDRAGEVILRTILFLLLPESSLLSFPQISIMP